MMVAKTLIVGLGSTGTDVCAQVADRLEWEYGDLTRAPWVQFLCLETDSSKASRFAGTPDFLPLTISATQWRAILGNRAAFDERIALNQWVDWDTLQQLEANEVSAGAGNIRMVGRLALLYDSNYRTAKLSINQKLAALRGLTGTQAAAKRGPLADGSDPQVEFADPDAITIVTVGTLCGGTCSGLAADFGFFLQTMAQPGDKTMAIFTIPHHQLARVVVPQADRYKKNAYTALVELNHYSLGNRGPEPPIRYIDGVVPTDVRPYKVTYLAGPRQPTPDAVEVLNRAIADRVFLNAAVPQVDPAAELVDVRVRKDRTSQAHAFSAFGLAAVEFPAYRVIEACAKRLLKYALMEWSNRALGSAQEQARLDEIGLTWQRLSDALLDSGDGPDLRRRLDQKVEEIVRLTASGADHAERSLNELRSKLLPEVRRIIESNRSDAVQSILRNVEAMLSARLLDYADGPKPALQVIRRAKDRLQALRAAAPARPALKTADARAAIDTLRVYQGSLLLWLFGLKRAALAGQAQRLRDAVRQEVAARIATDANAVLQEAAPDGKNPLGLLDQVARLLNPVEARLAALSVRLDKVCVALQARYDELAQRRPRMNGICIFKEGTSGEGTVPSEYQRCLQERAQDPSVPWDAQQRQEAAEVIRAWASLAGAVSPPRQAPHDWLLQDVSANAGLEAIPAEDLRALENAARGPFATTLTRDDVLARWSALDACTARAQDCAREASPFLHIEPALATYGNRGEIDTSRSVVRPDDSVHEASFVSAVSSVWPNAKASDCPDRFRAILLEEWYCFPLRGAPDVLGAGGICEAVCDELPTFHTRIDVAWRGLSARDADSREEAEGLLTLAVLLNVVTPMQGRLVANGWWPRRDLVDGRTRSLPLSFSEAVEMLAREGTDADGRSIANGRSVLAQEMASRRHALGASDQERASAFVSALEAAFEKNEGSQVPGWDKRRAGRLVRTYCAQDAALYSAYRSLLPPPDGFVNTLRKRAGERLAGGRIADKDGLYCPRCGGWVGEDEQDAAANGWACFVDPERHDFSPEATLR